MTKRGRATTMRFELAQGLFRRQRTSWETNKKLGMEEKDQSISYKKLNSHLIEWERMRAKRNLAQILGRFLFALFLSYSIYVKLNSLFLIELVFFIHPIFLI